MAPASQALSVDGRRPGDIGERPRSEHHLARFGVVSDLVKPFDLGSVLNALNIALNWHREAATRGPEKVEEDQLEKWIDSLEIL
jgi:hypothetical protein